MDSRDAAIAAILSQTWGPLLDFVPPDRVVEDLITNTRGDGLGVVIFGLELLCVEFTGSKAGKSVVVRCNQ